MLFIIIRNIYFGPLIGRFGNRLAKAQFRIGGETFKVPANEGQNALHGGPKGFGKFMWKSEPVKGDGFAGVKLSRTSPDGEMGFPGSMDVEVLYKLNNDNELSLEYKASSDKPTVCNLTWHPFFNLAGAGNGSILTHHFYIPSSFITVVDEELIPTGGILNVKDTHFDFMQPANRPFSIGERLGLEPEQLTERYCFVQPNDRMGDAAEQLKISGGGYDHNWVLDKPADTMGVACIAFDPKSGRRMRVSTQEPGLQVYTGQGFDGSVKGANGKAYHRFGGFVIEPQHFPDAPNQPTFFPPTLLTPGEVFTSKSVYKFDVGDSIGR